MSGGMLRVGGFLRFVLCAESPNDDAGIVSSLRVSCAGQAFGLNEEESACLSMQMSMKSGCSAATLAMIPVGAELSDDKLLPMVAGHGRSGAAPARGITHDSLDSDLPKARVHGSAVSLAGLSSATGAELAAAGRKKGGCKTPFRFAVRLARPDDGALPALVKSAAGSADGPIGLEAASAELTPGGGMGVQRSVILFASRQENYFRRKRVRPSSGSPGAGDDSGHLGRQEVPVDVDGSIEATVNLVRATLKKHQSHQR